MQLLLLISVLVLTGQAGSLGAEEAVPETVPEVIPESASTAESDTSVTRREALNKQLDALLAESVPESEYQEASDCLYRRNYRHVDVLSDSFLLFSKGGDYWINRLKQRCPALNQHLMLSFVSSGQSLCSGDRVYLSESADLESGFDRSGRPALVRGTCVLGKFEPINEPQAFALKEVAK